MNSADIDRPAGRWTYFGCAMGTCAIVWTNKGVCRFVLPLSSEAQVRAVISEREPSAIFVDDTNELPPWLRTVIEDVQVHLSGTKRSFLDVPVDVAWADGFVAQIYAACRQIAAGEVLTYGELADKLGQPGAARAVGAAMGRNPVPLIVPCHRVVAAGGKTGGFSAPGGAQTKVALLALEGVDLTQRQQPARGSKAAAWQLAQLAGQSSLF